MANISDAERKRRLLRKIPSDGSSIGNKALSRNLGWDLDLYFKIRDELAAEKAIEIGRGRGGSIRLPAARRKNIRRKKRKGKTSKKRRSVERGLYPGFLTALHLWADAQGWTDKVVQQTSDQGSRKTGGRFTRPDFVVFGSKKYEYTPGTVRDVESFEVKPLGTPIDAVFETAAHSRVTTKSYLALHVASDNPTEDELSRLESECQRFGIGLILFEDPSKFANWDYRIDPVRREPDPDLLEQFVRDQLTAKNQETIRKWVR